MRPLGQATYTLGTGLDLQDAECGRGNYNIIDRKVYANSDAFYTYGPVGIPATTRSVVFGIACNNAATDCNIDALVEIHIALQTHSD